MSLDLREWAQTLKNEVKLWIVRKLADLKNPGTIIYEIPDEYRPVLDTTETLEGERGYTYYDIGVSDLVEAGLLATGSTLCMTYKPHGGERRAFEATVTEGGDLLVDGTSYSAPSYAALHCIQAAGSTRNTVNGWTSWKTASGQTLADLRAEYLQKQEL